MINSQYSSLEKNVVLCEAVVDMLLKGAIQEVRDSSSLAFYSRLFLVAKKTGGWRPVSTSGSPSYATPSISSQEELQLPPERCPGFSILLGPFSKGSSKVVVTEEQCHGASSTAPTQILTSIYTDASAQGWGAHCAHMIAQGHWSTQQSKLHINVLELKAVLLALKTFVPQLSLHQRIIQVASDNTTVCAYINKLGGTRSWDMFALTWHLFAFCRKNKVVLTARRSSCHESCGRLTLQVSTDPSYRVISQSQDLQVVVTNRLPTSDRCFCNKIQSPAFPVCFSSARSQGSGSRCPGDELVRTSSLLLPSYSSLSTCGQEVNQLPELQDASCGSSLGNQRVASRSIGTVYKKTSLSSSKRKIS